VRFDERTVSARRRPWRVSVAGGKVLGTYGTKGAAISAAIDFTLIGNHERCWIRHADWPASYEPGLVERGSVLRRPPSERVVGGPTGDGRSGPNRSLFDDPGEALDVHE